MSSTAHVSSAAEYTQLQEQNYVHPPAKKSSWLWKYFYCCCSSDARIERAATTALQQTAEDIDLEAHWITSKEQLKQLASPLVAKIGEKLPLDLANIVAQYTLDLPLTNRHGARRKPGLHLEKIPLLPSDIHRIMDSRCPIYGDLRSKILIFSH